MVYRQYNTRTSGGRYNSGQFVSAGVQQEQNPNQRPQQQNNYQQQPQQQNRRQYQPQQQQQQNKVEPDNNQDFEKMEEEDDVIMKSETDADASGEDASRPHWMKSKLPGVKKISKKEKRRRQNEHLRRIITPKNALMVLNEMVLHEQITNQFKVEPAEDTNQYYKSQKTSYCADLTLDGVTYKGYGENKVVARNAAAEQAVRALVLRRMHHAANAATANAANAEGSGAGEADPLPMIQLASFALHKLFAEWECHGHRVPQLRPPPATVSESESEAVSAPPKPAKKPKSLPVNAGAMHPCMLLTYMRPHLEYRELAVDGDRPQNMLFTMGVDVDGATYIGKASNKKEARKAAAKSACTALFGVTFDELATASAPVVPPTPAN